MKPIIALVLLCSCASAPVVTRPAPEARPYSPVFTEEEAGEIAATCVAQAPLAEEECQCIALSFVGQSRSGDMQALLNRGFDLCVGREL